MQPLGYLPVDHGGSFPETGLVFCASIDDYLNVIKKHEYTRADKEEDRIKHVDYCNANTGPDIDDSPVCVASGTMAPGLDDWSRTVNDLKPTMVSVIRSGLLITGPPSID